MLLLVYGGSCENVSFMRPKDFIKPRVHAPSEEEFIEYEPLDVIQEAGPQAMLRRPKDFIEDEFDNQSYLYSPAFNPGSPVSAY